MAANMPRPWLLRHPVGAGPVREKYEQAPEVDPFLRTTNHYATDQLGKTIPAPTYRESGCYSNTRYGTR